MDKKYLQGYENITDYEENKKELLEQLENKIENDYDEYKNRIMTEHTKEQLIETFAYKTAVIQNFCDAIIDYISIYNEDDFILSEDTVNKIVNYKQNILELLCSGWLDFRHPEEYNFWYSYYEDLPNIIEEIVNYNI